MINFTGFIIHWYNNWIWFLKDVLKKKDLRKQYDRKFTRILNQLDKEFASIFEEYKDTSFTLSGEIPRHIWVLWWQGEDNLPYIPHLCLSQFNKYGCDVTLITKDNYSKYIDLDDLIGFYEKPSALSTKLSIQFISDIMKMRFLNKYGGIWLDATMITTDERFLNEISCHQFYTIRLENYDEDWCVSKALFNDSVWASVPENPLLQMVDSCLTSHALRHKRIYDYFMIEYAFLSCRRNNENARAMLDSVTPSNPDIYFLQQNEMKPFQEDLWNEVNSKTSIFKMAWRDIPPVKTDDGHTTYWGHVLEMLNQ